MHQSLTNLKSLKNLQKCSKWCIHKQISKENQHQQLFVSKIETYKTLIQINKTPEQSQKSSIFTKHVLSDVFINKVWKKINNNNFSLKNWKIYTNEYKLIKISKIFKKLTNLPNCPKRCIYKQSLKENQQQNLDFRTSTKI